MVETMSADRRFRAATYNVHGCVGTDGRHDPDRIIRVIRELDADVVALQEFTYPSDVALETRTPAVLASLDRYECALGPTRPHRNEHLFGNVVLTRHPIEAVDRIDLSIERREARGAVVMKLRAGDVAVHVLATHLGLTVAERRFQVRQLMEFLNRTQPERLIVLGDFNDWLPGRSVVHALDAALGKPPRVRSFPVWCPILPLDRVWVKPFAALKRLSTHVSPLARRASDHFPVIADVLWPDSH